MLISGIDELSIGTTLADINQPEALPMPKVDEPTLSMTFQVNTSPFAGKEGKFVTSRQLRERLEKELLTNVALKLEETGETDSFLVSGRGELHLTILLENMRREGYELAVSRPKVVVREMDGVKCEPFEILTLDIDEANQGAVMETLGTRRGDLLDMISDGRGRVRLDYRIPARGLIGFQSEFMTLTRGTGIMSHVFDEYAPMRPDIASRKNGVLISAEYGEVVAYALWKLQERGRMFVSPGEPVYEGMVIGIHSRENDLVVNPIKGKQLTNIRASGHDEAVVLTPPIQLTLESAVEFIADDELVEITPKVFASANVSCWNTNASSQPRYCLILPGNTHGKTGFMVYRRPHVFMVLGFCTGYCANQRRIRNNLYPETDAGRLAPGNSRTASAGKRAQILQHWHTVHATTGQPLPLSTPCRKPLFTTPNLPAGELSAPHSSIRKKPFPSSRRYSTLFMLTRKMSHNLPPWQNSLYIWLYRSHSSFQHFSLITPNSIL